MTFDITIPVLDEERTLNTQIKKLHDFVLEHFPNTQQWNIVIADNGSTDTTFDIATNLAKELPNILPIQLSERGVGRALKASWSQSQADIVGYMDLDLATDLSHFLEAYKAIDAADYDLVYGTRLHIDSKVINRPFKREVSSRVFNFLLQVYLGVGFSDGMCGFKWLKRERLPALMKAGAQNDGWFFSTELLTTAEWLDMNICELPVTWTDDISSSKVDILPLAKKYLKAMKALKQKRPF